MESSPGFRGCPRFLLSVHDLPMFSCRNHLKRNPAQKMKIKISRSLFCSFNSYCSSDVISQQQRSAQDVNGTSSSRLPVYVKFYVCNIFCSIFNLRINVWIAFEVSFAWFNLCGGGVTSYTTSRAEWFSSHVIIFAAKLCFSLACVMVLWLGADSSLWFFMRTPTNEHAWCRWFVLRHKTFLKTQLWCRPLTRVTTSQPLPSHRKDDWEERRREWIEKLVLI